MNLRRVVTGMSFVVLLVGLVACGDDDDSDAAAKGEPVAVAVTEWSVTPAPATVKAGDVTFTVQNNGAAVHELVVVRAASDTALATKADGSVDEDQVAAADAIGEVEDVEAGKSKPVTLNLTAGTYVLFCNLIEKAGTSHFKQGMHVTFTVS